MRSFILTPLFLAALASAGTEPGMEELASAAKELASAATVPSSTTVPTASPSSWGSWGIQGFVDEKCEAIGGETSDRGWSGSEPRDCTSLKDNVKSLGSRGFTKSDVKPTVFKDDHCGGDKKEINADKDCQTSKTIGFKPKSFKVDKK